jgi:hypothetical protein
VLECYRTLQNLGINDRLRTGLRGTIVAPLLVVQESLAKVKSAATSGHALDLWGSAEPSVLSAGLVAMYAVTPRAVLASDGPPLPG